jgi:hypothetical protein
MRVDPTGKAWWHWLVAAVVAVVVVAVVVAAVVVTAGAAVAAAAPVATLLGGIGTVGATTTVAAAVVTAVATAGAAIAIGAAVVTNHIENAVMINNAESEVGSMSDAEIDSYINSIGDYDPETGMFSAPYNPSVDKYERIKVLTAIKKKYGGSNSIYSMSAEWQYHNVAYDLTKNANGGFLKEIYESAKVAQISIDAMDDRPEVSIPSYLFWFLGIL